MYNKLNINNGFTIINNNYCLYELDTLYLYIVYLIMLREI